jgi:hypothetical protein
MSYKTMATMHFIVFPMCLIAGLGDLISGTVSILTSLNLVFAALNLWLGIQRWEGK